MSESAPYVLTRVLTGDLETPVTAFLKLAHGKPYAMLLESVQGGEARGRYSIIAWDPDTIWRVCGGKAEINTRAGTDVQAFEPDAQSPFASLRKFLAASKIELPRGLPPMASALFGYLGYDMVRQVEHLPHVNPDPLGLPEAILIRPRLVAIFDNVRDEITVVTPVWTGGDASRREGLARLDAVEAALAGSLPALDAGDAAFPDTDQLVSNTTHAEYLAMVARAKDYIRAGDCFQIVPSQRFRMPFALPPFALYRSLRRVNPSPFLYFLDYPGFSVVGSSPEILVRLRDNKVTIRPIAGTLPRGKTPEEDAANEARLLADPKERAEHLMLVDLGRNDAGRVAKTGSVKVTDSFFVERYSHVMHIVSNVEAEIAEGKDQLDALAAGFPAGTLTGAPKIRAMEIIDELEKEKRGVYAGAVGYFSPDGAMDTCIVLRTAIVKDGWMYAQAGGGVVADSDAESEFQETVNKAKALVHAAGEAVRFVSGHKRNAGPA
jgi:anthranilate synthase component I